MNMRTVWIALGAVVVIAVGVYAFSLNRAVAPSESRMVPAPQQFAPSERSNAALTIVTLTDTGFTPTTVTIGVGETVRFTNTSSRGMWVGADEHPTHTEYDGTSTREHCANGVNITGSFDQCTPIENGASWDYTFEKVGTFGFHNHVGASSVGTVTVN